MEAHAKCMQRHEKQKYVNFNTGDPSIWQNTIKK